MSKTKDFEALFSPKAETIYVHTKDDIEATRWYKDGDHASVYSYMDIKSIHSECGCRLCDHGQVDVSDLGMALVCPGDWVVEIGVGTFCVMKDKAFAKAFREGERDND
jgi:hypothetical protein